MLWHGLGYVFEKSKRIEEARDAYSKSLELNREFFDLLGLGINHAALAHLAMSGFQEFGHHRKKADDPWFCCVPGAEAVQGALIGSFRDDPVSGNERFIPF